MRPAPPYGKGEQVRVLVWTDSGTTLAVGTVTDCSRSGEDSWAVRVRACGTEHRFTVAHGYLERGPRAGRSRTNQTSASDETETP